MIEDIDSLCGPRLGRAPFMGAIGRLEQNGYPNGHRVADEQIQADLPICNLGSRGANHWRSGGTACGLFQAAKQKARDIRSRNRIGQTVTAAKFHFVRQLAGRKCHRAYDGPVEVGSFILIFHPCQILIFEPYTGMIEDIASVVCPF